MSGTAPTLRPEADEDVGVAGAEAAAKTRSTKAAARGSASCMTAGPGGGRAGGSDEATRKDWEVGLVGTGGRTDGYNESQ